MRLCVSTVVSPNHYLWFIPFFSLSAKKAYPKCRVKIFVKGEVDPKIKENLSLFKNPDIYENVFSGIPNRKSTCNALRHLVDPIYYRGFNLVYPTDVDFIILPHKRSHIEYYLRIMEKTHQPFAACGGPAKGFRKRPKGVTRWVGHYGRVAAGCSMYNSRFFQVTKNARRYYLKVLKSGRHDKFDKLPAASYREYDEVMLQRIIRMSGLKVPIHKNLFLTGEKANAEYRDVHLGDFKFPARWRNKAKMRRILTNYSVKAARNLISQDDWKKMVSFVNENGDERVIKLYNNMLKHLKTR